MDFVKKNKVTVIAIAIVVLGALGYFFFLNGNNTQSGIVVTGANPNITIANQEFISLFSQLRRVELDTEIFSNPQFDGLVDFTRPVSIEPVGRNNPFAPI